MPTFIKVEQKGQMLIYTDTDGHRYTYSGGDANWRMNNPGNIKQSALTTRYGAIGSCRLPTGTYAVFPSPQRGKDALRALLGGPHYAGKTIYAAMGEFINVEGGSRDYRPAIAAGLAPLDIHKAHMGDMQEEGLAKLMSIIATNEGNHPGRVTKQERMTGEVVDKETHKQKLIHLQAEDLPPGTTVSKILAGEVDGVVVHGPDGDYVRQRPNETESDNLGENKTRE